MLVKSSLTSILLVLASCGVNPGPVVVDETFSPYIQRFETEIGVSADGISMQFGNLEKDYVGVCSISWVEKSVTIDKTFWEQSNESQKEELIYHELGHCAMGLEHDEGLRPVSNCPKSIMYPEMLGGCYPAFVEYYKEELRSKKLAN